MLIKRREWSTVNGEYFDLNQSPLRKEINNDKTSSKKTFTNLDVMGSAVAGGDHCCPDGSAEESNAGVIATTSKD